MKPIECTKIDAFLENYSRDVCKFELYDLITDANGLDITELIKMVAISLEEDGINVLSEMNLVNLSSRLEDDPYAKQTLSYMINNFKGNRPYLIDPLDYMTVWSLLSYIQGYIEDMSAIYNSLPKTKDLYTITRLDIFNSIRKKRIQRLDSLLFG